MQTNSIACARVRAVATRPMVLAILLSALSLLAACSGPAADTVDSATATPATSTPAPATPAAANAPASSHASPPNTPLVVPMQAMVLALMSRAQSEGHDFGPSFPVPATWVFAPDGRLHERIEDAAALATLDDAGFRTRDPSVRDNPLPLDSVLAAIAGETGTALAAGDGRWTVVTLLASRGCEDTCPRFAQQAQALDAGHATDVRSIVLTLEH